MIINSVQARGCMQGLGRMIHESIQHISAVGSYLCLQLRGSKRLLTKEVPMQRAEMTAFTNASRALSTNVG